MMGGRAMELAFYYVSDCVCSKLPHESVREKPGTRQRENVWWHQLVTYKLSTSRW